METTVDPQTNELKAWIGRSEKVHDTIGATPVLALTATLERAPDHEPDPSLRADARRLRRGAGEVEGRGGEGQADGGVSGAARAPAYSRMHTLRLVRLLLTLALLAWSGWFFRLALTRHAQAWFWGTTGPVYLSADRPEHIVRIQQSTDWQTPLLCALLPLAAVGLWSLLRTLLKARRAP